MKIALVSPYDFASVGGVNNHIIALYTALTEEGHQAKIIAPSSKEPDSLDDSIKKDFVRIGHVLIPMPASGSWAHVSFSPLTKKRIEAVFEENAFDVVHVHEPFIPRTNHYVVYAAKKMGLPVVATFHAAKDKGAVLYKILRPLINWRLIPLIDARICVSEASKKLISTYFPGEYKIIPNMVDTEHFSPEQQPIPEFLDGKVNLLYVGRPEKRKGLDHLIDAYEVLINKGVANTRLIIVGGDDKGKYKRLVHSRILDTYVVFAGFVSYDELPRYYRIAAKTGLFCAPNIGQESFGIVLIEAMACGAPIVASGLKAFMDVAQNNTAIFVEPRNPESLAKGLEALIKDEKRRKEMGQQGLLEAVKYNKNGVTGRVLEVYRSVLNS